MGLRDLFARKPKTVEIPKETLAKIVAPFLVPCDDKTDAEKLAHGWDETREWLRIGFDPEGKDKGAMYHLLYPALQHIIYRISATESDSPNIQIDEKELKNLKENYTQLSWAATMLKNSAKKQGQTQSVVTKDGSTLHIPLIQIYNRPGESHRVAAYNLEEAVLGLDEYFGRPPSIKRSPDDHLGAMMRIVK